MRYGTGHYIAAKNQTEPDRAKVHAELAQVAIDALALVWKDLTRLEQNAVRREWMEVLRHD